MMREMGRLPLRNEIRASEIRREAADQAELLRRLNRRPGVFRSWWPVVAFLAGAIALAAFVWYGRTVLWVGP